MAEKEKAQTYDAYKNLIRTIPEGCVIHYEGVSGSVGKGIGRSVSHLLSELPEDTDIPWWRVVGKEGEHGLLRTEGDRRIRQRELLEAEGIVFDWRGRFIFEDYRYRPPAPERLAA